VLLLAALGLGPALVGSLGWNVASSRLSPATAGQLIVLEPLFALTYAAVWTGHAPAGAALVGQVLLLAGAVWGVWVTASGRGGAAAGAEGTGPRRWRRVGPRLSAAGS
jgi:drug/metabolite transporter (DMT)-like permease